MFIAQLRGVVSATCDVEPKARPGHRIRTEPIGISLGVIRPTADTTATASLFDPRFDAGPAAVAAEITRILSLPAGKKPFRGVELTQPDVEHAIAVTEESRTDYVSRMGFGELPKELGGI